MPGNYILAHVSNPSTPNPKFSAEPPAREGGHSDAIWQTKSATLPNGDGIILTAGSDQTIRLWNPLNGAVPVRTVRPRACLGIVGLDVDPSAEGAKFFVANSLDSVVSRFSMDGVEEARKEFGPAETWSLSLSPTNPHMATAGLDAKVQILSSEIETFGNVLFTTNGSGTFGTAVEYSRDGRFLAVATETGHVSLVDASSGSLVSTFPAHSAPIRALVFTSSLLITASDDKRINIFDLRALASGSGGGGSRKGQVASLGGHEGWVVSLAIRNERLLASGSSDGTIKLWDLESPGSALSTLRDHRGDVWSLAWLPDRGPPVIQGLGGTAAGISGGSLGSAGEDCVLRWWKGGG